MASLYREVVNGKPYWYLREMARVEVTALPGALVATVLHHGDYATLGAAYQASSAWLADHGYRVRADPWESYLDEPDVPDPGTLIHLPAEPVGSQPTGIPT